MIPLMIVCYGIVTTMAQTPVDSNINPVPREDIPRTPAFAQTSVENEIASSLRDQFHRDLMRYLFHKGLISYPASEFKQLAQPSSSEKEKSKNMPGFGPIVNNAQGYAKKAANLYGMNRPMGLRHTRLADFGSMILPNKNSDTSRSAVIRYG